MMDKTLDNKTGQVQTDIEQLLVSSSGTGHESVAAKIRRVRKTYNIPLLLMMTVIVVFGLIVL